jgi:hypothetical protein
MPERLRRMIDMRIALPGPEERQTLEVACVAGMEFSSATAAAGLEADVVKVEMPCEALARRYGLICYPLSHAVFGINPGNSRQPLGRSQVPPTSFARRSLTSGVQTHNLAPIYPSLRAIPPLYFEKGYCHEAVYI